MMKHHSAIRWIVLTHKLAAILILLAMTATTLYIHSPVTQASDYSVIILSHYNKSLKIGQSFYLVGISSNGKRISWKSSSSKTASVNTYGLVTAKKAGSCKITAKVSGAEASCRVTVQKTAITLSAASVSMENGASFRLSAKTSNGSAVTWKSSRSSVVTIDDRGNMEALKVGETVITATADGTKKTCRVTVKKPKVTISQTGVSLYRTQTHKLTARVSSGRPVSWRSRKKSVATVDENGVITAKKHGTAIITATVDGVSRECEVIVSSPVIKLSKTSVSLKMGKSVTLNATVSSGIKPVWTSSKTSVATVNKSGKVTARKKGTCYIYAAEDGTKTGCHITVTA